MEPDRPSAAELAAPSRAPVAAAAAALAFVALKVSPLSFADPDMFHQLALAREYLARGAMPARDPFAYTPTRVPLVHHEWGAGVLWLAVTRVGGAGGFLAFKFLLVAAVIALTIRAARRAGAPTWAVLLAAFPAAHAAHYGFTTIRAGLLSMVALAALENVLHAARARRGWVLAALPLFALWINVHAGFVVGLGVLGLEAIERAARREPWAHLAAVTVASACLTLATPWGVEFPRHLALALTMKRPDIPEWSPLWTGGRWADVAVWGCMVGVAARGVARLGLRRCAGAAAVALFALASLKHHRHFTLFAVLWFSRVPAWLAGDPALEAWGAVVARRRAMIAALFALVAAVWSAIAATARPWELVVPSTVAYRAEGWPTYPVGAVAYLDAQDFRGNVMTPFIEGAWVSWQLAPRGVRVSYDSRYEAAYTDLVSRAHGAFYAGAPGWADVLRRWPPDVVLVPRDAAVLRPMLGLPGWRVTYGDDLYVLFARTGSRLPFVDRRHVEFVARFP